jgi:hypothetical protein
MINVPDIKSRIVNDFGGYAEEASRLIEEAILNDDNFQSNNIVSFNSHRIIRCIIFLADKNIEALKGYIGKAKEDPRDVMFWAEYINHGDKNPLHVWDFSNPFGENEI